MSLYYVQKFLYQLNRDPALQERYAADRRGALAGYELTGEEVEALVDVDIGLLFHLGVNGQILMHFAALHRVEWSDYLQRMRDGIARHGPVREGLFAIGQPPTGSRDPFALRRAALGILRILIEGELELDLVAAIDAAVGAYAELEPDADCRRQLYDFIFDRLRAWYADAGTQASVYLCVRALNPPSPLDFHRRVEAVADFAGIPEAAALAAANKRVSNLLDKSGEEAGPGAVAPELLSEAAEEQLLARLRRQSEEVAPLFAAGDYREGLTRLASLRDDVDRFFDEVMVMVDDSSVRANRLRLLRELRDLFLQVADISLL